MIDQMIVRTKRMVVRIDQIKILKRIDQIKILKRMVSMIGHTTMNRHLKMIVRIDQMIVRRRGVGGLK